MPVPGAFEAQSKFTTSVRVSAGVPVNVLLLKYLPIKPLPVAGGGGGGTGAVASSLPICERYALTAFTSLVLKLTPVCARTASASVVAEPSCRYGAVAHTSRSVGGSIPVSVAPRR